MDSDIPPAEYRHVYEFEVKFGDIDSMGHVNNVKFLSYLEDARVQMFYGDPVRKGEESLHGLVVARHEIDYRRPMSLTFRPVRVETWVTEIRNASFRLAYHIRDDEQVFATAASVMVAFDPKKGRARRFTPSELEFLKRYLPPS
ncbi:acyl-CoA thioesterase [Thermomonospora curvata]|uniref:Thioesterase superfamily protein n=1 Tax=Thermomonospora curvata (strain ATCC 19995 / DSM 43183 / JCM 3096 / KCTC 9072 / NBRC 15933 / NCIMB 10081 / Henssen B9) TaxID=471852 RepID=D1A9X7_THECD|nr:thioesterase family protein [Thermomonospora curvata]ACY96913.1 thioesterase superfamily protein [Thermomonospora curvata DSM 43183]